MASSPPSALPKEGRALPRAAPRCGGGHFSAPQAWLALQSGTRGQAGWRGTTWGSWLQPSGRWPWALGRDSRSLVALFEVLRKSCSSLSLGFLPGGLWKKWLEPTHIYPLVVKDQGQHPVWVRWCLSFLPGSGSAQAKRAALAGAVLCDFIPLPLGGRILTCRGRRGIFLDAIRGPTEVQPSGSALPFSTASLCASG